jgi:hypothetical protein
MGSFQESITQASIVVAASAGIIALGIAWLTYWRGVSLRHEHEYKKNLLKIDLLTSLFYELGIISVWVGDGYPPNKDYVNDPEFKWWFDHYGKKVYRFSHIAIEETIRQGAQLGCSGPFIGLLVRLHHAIVLFNQALDLHPQLANACPETLLTIHSKIDTLGDYERFPATKFTEDELTIMEIAFNQFHHLHIAVIGHEDSKGIHLFGAYKRVREWGINEKIVAAKHLARYKRSRLTRLLIRSLGVLPILVGLTFIVFYFIAPTLAQKPLARTHSSGLVLPIDR